MAKKLKKAELEAQRKALIEKAKQDTLFTEQEFAWLESIGATPNGKDKWVVDDGNLYVSLSVSFHHGSKQYTCGYQMGYSITRMDGDNLIDTFNRVVDDYEKGLAVMQERFDKVKKFAEQYK